MSLADDFAWRAESGPQALGCQPLLFRVTDYKNTYCVVVVVLFVPSLSSCHE